MNVEKILKNKDNIYFAHGSGTDKKTILESIMTHGVRCSHGALQYTSIYLGTPDNIKDYGKDIIENWFYKNSGIVFIISLPRKYFILEREELNTMKKEHSAFYYVPNQEDQKKYSLMNKPHIYKEFLVGYYNSNTREFVENENYYEKLSEEKQKEMLNTIEQNYIKIIEESCGVELYRELVKKYNHKYALDEDIDETNNLIDLDKLIQDIDEKISELDKEEEEYKKNRPYIAPEIPDSLKDYVYVLDGKIYSKNKLPKELEKDFEIFTKINDLLEEEPVTELDQEYEKYAKLYEERFNKKAYIAEPSGTKEQTINAIKICLEKDEDILDQIYYPNNNVFYSDEIKELKREQLVNIIDEYEDISDSSIIKELLNRLERELNNYNYKDDNKFMTYGRREFLRKEFTDILEEKEKRNNKYQDALINLIEYIKAESSFFNPLHLPKEESDNFQDLLKLHDEYNKEGIICNNEKEIILQMINELKEFIK